MQSRPLVSIIIPVYNGADYLSIAIESALAQTYDPKEILVINDGSTDDGATEEIALSYGSKIRYYKKPNGHVASALNLALREMKGEYFSWLSHDDVYLPHKLEAQVMRLKDFPENTILYSRIEIIDESGKARPYQMPTLTPEQFWPALIVHGFLHGCTLLIPRHAFTLAGTFNESLRTTQDYDLWFRMKPFFRFELIDQVLVQARFHSGQDTSKIPQTMFRENNQLYVRILYLFTKEDLRPYCGERFLEYYLECAESFRRRRFFKAAWFAQSLALNELGQQDLIGIIQAVGSMVRSCGQLGIYFLKAKLREIYRLSQRWIEAI